MEPFATPARWLVELVTAVRDLSTAQVVVIVAAIALVGFVAARVLDLVGILVRGHAPAELDTEDLAEAFAIAVGERLDKLVDYAHDSYGIAERAEDLLAAQVETTAGHAARSEDLLAQLLAATRTTTLAVQALDDLDDTDVVDDSYRDRELDRLRAELTTTEKG